MQVRAVSVSAMITLYTAVHEAILRHAELTYPYECVGLLLGRSVGEQVFVEDVFCAQNSWTPALEPAAGAQGHSQCDRFYLDPREYLRADVVARRRGLDVVGCYHSHPDHPAVPSEQDRVGAQGVGGGVWFSFLIQSVWAGKGAELAAWLLVDDGSRFCAEVVRVVDVEG